MQKKHEFYINGQWVAPTSLQTLPVINPSTEQAYAEIALGTQADTDSAVAAARAAFESWRDTPASERFSRLKRLADIYDARTSEMAQAISDEMGAPIDMALAQQAAAGTGNTRSLLQVIEGYELESPLAEDPEGSYIVHDPVGVCALITPWNWPISQVTLKVIPALAAGCTVVLKPSEIAPMSSVLFAEMIDEAGFPAGVFNLVNGDGPGVGTQLSVHPDVDMVSFTGSTRAGVLISKNAADTVKRVSLELGGKGANIVFADADEKAVERGVLHCFNNTGQSCNAPTRMLVQREIYPHALEMAKAAAAKASVGLSSEHGKHMGPLVSATQFEKVQGLIQAGIDEGATVLAGGLGKPEGLETGYFVKPTIFADVSNDMTIAQEEIFGPVLCLIPFDTEEEAVNIANDTPYGLTNYLQTQDRDKAQRVARRLRSGMVNINGNFQGGCAPFGGFGQSGNGREGGRWGFEDFLEVKAIGGW